MTDLYLYVNLICIQHFLAKSMYTLKLLYHHVRGDL
jgi:hypothetical protein